MGLMSHLRRGISPVSGRPKGTGVGGELPVARRGDAGVQHGFGGDYRLAGYRGAGLHGSYLGRGVLFAQDL